MSSPRLAVRVRSSQFSSMPRALFFLFGPSRLGKFVSWGLRRSMLLAGLRLLGRHLGFRTVNCCSAHLVSPLRVRLKNIGGNANIRYLACRSRPPDVMCEAHGFEGPNEIPANVYLPPAQPETGRPGIGVVVVVPVFSPAGHLQRAQPPDILAGIALLAVA